jgi:hypothetical protein
MVSLVVFASNSGPVIGVSARSGVVAISEARRGPAIGYRINHSRHGHFRHDGGRVPDVLAGVQSRPRVWRRGGAPLVEMGPDRAAPEGWDQGDGAGDGEGPGEGGGLICGWQAKGGEGARGVGVMVGMARGVQHDHRAEPVRRVPAVAEAHRLGPAIGPCCAEKAVVLDVVGEEDLALDVEGEEDPDH